MQINLYNNYPKKIDFDYNKIIKDIESYDSDSEIALILVDLDEIHQINKEYRHKDFPTDVISFESDDEEDEKYRGEIFLCVDKAYEQAKLYEHSVEREFAFLLIHGVLHLHGYDHLTPEEEKIMFEKQEEILTKLNYLRS